MSSGDPACCLAAGWLKDAGSTFLARRHLYRLIYFLIALRYPCTSHMLECGSLLLITRLLYSRSHALHGLFMYNSCAVRSKSALAYLEQLLHKSSQLAQPYMDNCFSSWFLYRRWIFWFRSQATGPIVGTPYVHGRPYMMVVEWLTNNE